MLSKLITTVFCLTFSLALYSQSAVELEFSSIEKINLIEKDNFTVYPNPIINNFRIDLKSFVNSDVKLEIINNDLQIEYSENINGITDNYLQLSVYTLGLKPGKHTVLIYNRERQYTNSITIL